jgi:mono/diheme cytochrome c family protein
MRLASIVAVAVAIGGSALAQPPAAEPAAADARALFSSRCQGCHNDFVNNAPTLFTLQAYKPDVIIASLKTGKMQRMAIGLSDEEIASIAKFITSAKLAD